MFGGDLHQRPSDIPQARAMQRVAMLEERMRLAELSRRTAVRRRLCRRAQLSAPTATGTSHLICPRNWPKYGKDALKLALVALVTHLAGIGD